MHTLGKLLWFFLTPSNLLLAGVVACAFWAAFSGRRGPAFLAGFLALAIGAAALSPLPNWLLLPLEERFPDHGGARTVKPDGIVILGGGIDGAISAARPPRLELIDAGDRFLEMIALARWFPEARLVYSGGSGEAFEGGISEAEEVKRKAIAYGLDPARITFEPDSRNTWENALRTHDRVRPLPGERWLLVTSAFHMPRAMGAFRKAGFDPQAHPVDFRTRGPADRGASFASVAHGLGRIDLAAKEWLGLAAYYLTGRSNALFPKP